MVADAPFLELPNFLVADLETQRVTPKGKDPGKAGISVLAAWGLKGLHPYFWILDASRFPRALITEDHAVKVWTPFEGLITWNGIGFDDRVIKGAFPQLRKTYTRKRHVDLHALCCLLQAGVDPERLRQPLEANWATMVPTMREDLVSSGWSLESVGRGTLKLGKTEGPQGLAAIDAWQNGRYSEVCTYCIGDVALTRALYLFAWEHGYLVSEERGRVNIPREVLA